MNIIKWKIKIQCYLSVFIAFIVMIYSIFPVNVQAASNSDFPSREGTLEKVIYWLTFFIYPGITSTGVIGANKLEQVATTTSFKILQKTGDITDSLIGSAITNTSRVATSVPSVPERLLRTHSVPSSSSSALRSSFTNREVSSGNNLAFINNTTATLLGTSIDISHME